MQFAPAADPWDRLLGHITATMDVAISEARADVEGLDELAEDGQSYQNVLERCRSHPAEFRKVLMVHAGGKISRFADVIDDWQRRDFEAMDDAWRYCTFKTSKRPQIRRGYLERPRGHSKTTDNAVQILWALFASDVNLNGYFVAESEEQGKILIEKIEEIIDHNPWLNAYIEYTGTKITAKETGATCKVLSKNPKAIYGQTPDFVVCDELTHWSSHDMWTAVFSGMMKRPTACLVVITNAGYDAGKSWQWGVRQQAIEKSSWYFQSLNGPQASWLSQEDLDEAADLLTEVEYDRLVNNRWQMGRGHGLPWHQVLQAVRLVGPPKAPKFDHGCDFVIGGLDFGLKSDRTSLVWLGIKLATGEHAKRMLGGQIHLLGHRTWYPKDYGSGVVNIADVEKSLVADAADLRAHCIYADEWQAENSVQKLTSQGTLCKTVNFRSTNVVRRMARDLMRVFRTAQILLYEDSILEQDLQSLIMEYNEVSRTYKILAQRDKDGHADSGFALAIANMFCCMIIEELTGQQTGEPDDGYGEDSEEFESLEV